jgi:hypothetical protein
MKERTVSIKGYKGFDKDLRCRGMQYEVGKTYSMKGDPSVCNRGFHFCEKLADIDDYYKFRESRICEIEAIGVIVKDKEKSATNKIKIIRELSKAEIIALVNTGKDNSGYFNSGSWNSGDRNSGSRNSGSRNSGSRNSGRQNSGSWNSGSWNSGSQNSGNLNSGRWNSGSWNSGSQNSGNLNSGDFNSCDRSAGVFMSRRISYEAFNKSLTNDEFEKLINSDGYRICKNFQLVKFRVRASTGKSGDFQYMSYKTSWKVFWNSLSFRERLAVMNMPYFDRDVFFEITGIRVPGHKESKQ